MMIQIRDRGVLSSLPILSLRAYLASRLWRDAGSWGQRPATIYMKEKSGVAYEVIVPSRDTLPDYAEVMAENIATIATVENRSQFDVFNDVVGAGSDVIQVRSSQFSSAQEDVLSLQREAGLFKDAYDLMAAAARAAEKTQPTYRGRLSADVADYLDTVRPLPSFYEGYCLTLHSPVPAAFGDQEDFGDYFHAPFPRLVTMKLDESLRYISQALDTTLRANTLDYFDQGISHGISANFCDSVAALTSAGDGISIDLFWANVRPSTDQASHFEFSRSSAEILEEAARHFRKREPYLDESVVAHVVRLEREPSEFDGRADIVYVRDGQPLRLTVEFESSAYSIVIRAFEEKIPIQLDGDIYREGNRYELRRPRNLALIFWD